MVGSILEHLGFVNLPLRRYGTESRVFNGPNETQVVIKNFSKIVTVHDQPIGLGGTSLEQRDSGVVRLIDASRIKDDLDQLEIKANETEYEFVDLYRELRRLYKKAVLYKSTDHMHDNLQIEYTVQLQDYDYVELSKRLRKEFGDIKIIHMRRDFGSWFESRLGALFTNSFNQGKKYVFMLFHRYSMEHRKYSKFINKTPDVKIDFEDLFEPRTELTIERICELFGHRSQTIDWRTKQFDLYGKLTPYKNAFTLSDYPNKYVSKHTLNLAKRAYMWRSSAGRLAAELLLLVLSNVDYLKFKRARRIDAGLF